ncbi:uncharacterized protein LAESUDRAFT_732784 [Laetiporus sulphureus 93-53]|uniref:Uncharacterized protein n=1 Tax=Laetiporus sulphureus 93-53 TaxID=1314785 RepID=A0A165AZE5_9APHY|nr:uncharacterized protein LAESUDRAFT_732784 [Laetiporus sulphureus 93-53]KZS99939.1 hypothetical protein LAESUDRAFT_732784 [Laetiporus sulphureus 93-53]
MFYGRRKKSVSAHCTRNLSTPAITSRLLPAPLHAAQLGSHARPGSNGAMSYSDDSEDKFLARLLGVSRLQGGAAFNQPAISGIDSTATKRYQETQSG